MTKAPFLCPLSPHSLFFLKNLQRSMDAFIWSRWPYLLSQSFIYIFCLFVLQTHVVDFYISDFQSGLRALIKTGSGTRVTPFVDDSFVVDINPGNKDLSPEFVRWLGKRNLSSDERQMRLKEG
jgi:hypothetical protein